jgi:predicted aldo/keto reductase-like oxidoreductase
VYFPDEAICIPPIARIRGEIAAAHRTGLTMTDYCHCEAGALPDEAIYALAIVCIRCLDCFVAKPPRNDRIKEDFPH